MSINATLLVQAGVFLVLIWITMETIWPLLLGAIEKREKTIADGLAAAAKGQRDLEEAEQKSEELVSGGRQEAARIVARAQQRHDEIVNAAKDDADTEAGRILATARADIERERSQVREALRKEVSACVVSGVEKVLGAQVDEKQHARLLKSVADSLH